MNERRCAHIPAGPVGQARQDEIFGLQDLSVQKILMHFLGDEGGDVSSIAGTLSRIRGVAHVGIEVDSIEEALLRLRRENPERGYRLIKTFRSVGVPKNFENSTCTIAHVKPDDPSFPSLELFVVTWEGRYREIRPDQRRRLIAHTALSARSAGDVETIIRDLALKSPSIQCVVPPQINLDAGEIFAYLINDQGEKLEIVHHVGSTADSGQDQEGAA